MLYKFHTRIAIVPLAGIHRKVTYVLSILKTLLNVKMNAILDEPCTFSTHITDRYVSQYLRMYIYMKQIMKKSFVMVISDQNHLKS